MLLQIFSYVLRWVFRNVGFIFGPFCPIYGFGGVLGYIIMHPLGGHLLGLYFIGAALATTFEYLVGILMRKVLHQVWWDYNDKPFNYKGIICLESTIAWGFYAIITIIIRKGSFYDCYLFIFPAKLA